jgi:hypothetical protein
MDFIAIFAAVASRLVLDLLTANGACIIHHLLIGEDSLDETGELIELRLSLLRGAVVVPGLVLQGSHILGHTFDELLDQLEVVGSLNLRVRRAVVRLSHGGDRAGILNLLRVGSGIPLA